MQGMIFCILFQQLDKIKTNKKNLLLVQITREANFVRSYSILSRGDEQ